MEKQQAAMEQLTQAYSKGKFEAEEWKSLQEAMPGQLKQVAQALGMTSDAQLYEGLKNGTVSMEEFMDTIALLDKKGLNGLKSFQKQAKDSTMGVGTAIANLNTSITKGITNAMMAVDEALKKNKLPTIGQMINSVGDKIGKFGEKVANAIGKVDFAAFAKSAQPYINDIKRIAKETLINYDILS